MQELVFRHQWDQFIHMRIEVGIVQPYPDTEFPQCVRLFGDTSTNRPALLEARAVFDIHPVSTGVLGNNQQLLDTSFDQTLCLLQYAPHRPTD